MRNLLSLLVAGCSAALATTPEPPPPAQLDDVAALRAFGPPALDALLARYDRAPTPELADEIDAVAGQRYATVSRLYWYTDLAAAEQAARTRHVPILSLRMLGNLGEDLSCANSRLFRATLYANADVSAYLRDHFVLHWSSERPVPRVTIDFGDGKHRLVRTTTGNSAHYVLDEDGRVLDVLPGLYTPAAFETERRGGSGRARLAVRGKPDTDREQAIVAFQRAHVIDAAAAAWARLAGTAVLPSLRRLARAADVESALALAQRAAMSKARVEVPDLQRLGQLGAIADGDVAAWASAGQVLLGIGDLGDLTSADLIVWSAQRPTHADKPIPPLFDARSRALIEQLASTSARPLSRAQLDAMVARLEQSTVADTAQNQLQLRVLIAQRIVDTGGRASFSELNAWTYATAFHTPADDAWLGLVTDAAFSGLPADGIVP